MMKKRQNNDVTNHIGMLYTENDTKQLWSIRWGMNYNEDNIG